MTRTTPWKHGRNAACWAHSSDRTRTGESGKCSSHVLLALIVGLSIVLMLVRPRGIPEVYWIGGGALLLVVCGLLPLRLAGKAVAEGS